MKVKLSGSFRRYHADPQSCELDADPLQDGLAAALQQNRFRSIDGPTAEKESVGWTSLEGLVPASFEDFNPWLGKVLVLGLRVDVKRVPAGALKVRRLEREAAERGAVGDRILPDRRREILEELEGELLSRQVPNTSVAQVVWNTQTGHLLFSATGEALNIAFRAIFRETFGRAVELVVPAGEAELYAEERERMNAFEGALPGDFRPQ